RAADGYDAQCYSSKPDLVCCTHVDTWALQGSNGFYLTVNNVWNADCGGIDNLSDVHGGPFTCPALMSTKAAPNPSSAVGVTSPGKFELFEVFTCSIQDGSGRQFPKGTMF